MSQIFIRTNPDLKQSHLDLNYDHHSTISELINMESKPLFVQEQRFLTKWKKYKNCPWTTPRGLFDQYSMKYRIEGLTDDEITRLYKWFPDLTELTYHYMPDRIVEYIEHSYKTVDLFDICRDIIIHNLPHALYRLDNNCIQHFSDDTDIHEFITSHLANIDSQYLCRVVDIIINAYPTPPGLEITSSLGSEQFGIKSQNIAVCLPTRSDVNTPVYVPYILGNLDQIENPLIKVYTSQGILKDHPSINIGDYITITQFTEDHFQDELPIGDNYRIRSQIGYYTGQGAALDNDPQLVNQTYYRHLSYNSG